MLASLLPRTGRSPTRLVNDIITAAPSTIRIVDEINNEILTGSLYKALKAAKKLIQYEQELLAHAK